MSAQSRSAETLIARRAAAELEHGDVVNIGIGMPMHVLEHVDPDLGIVLHGENGMLGLGRFAEGDEADPDQTTPGAIPVTARPGASFFSLLDSGVMMRGHHLDKVLMGGFQVDSAGTLANWILSEHDITGGIGGAMDLAVGVDELIVLMRHTTREGDPRLVERCSLPPTAVRVVSRIITELAVVDVGPDGFVLRELQDGSDLDLVMRLTGAPLEDGRA